MNVLLSIKPKYAEAILCGDKKYEFRRLVFKKKDIREVYIYSNNGVGRIIGSFKIEEILKGTPLEIWESCHEMGGITKDEYFSYFEGSDIAFGIRIGAVKRFDEPIDPSTIIKDFTPPQSFRYIEFGGNNNLPFFQK